MSGDRDVGRGVMRELYQDALARIALAITIAERHGMTDGAHHKQWVIDQMVRALIPNGYEEWVPDEWDEGVEP